MSSAEARVRLGALLRERSVRSGNVRLASGVTSDWFVDCKQTVLSAEGHVHTGVVMLDALQGFDPHPVAVAGVALGGCPLASAVSFASFASGKPLDAVYVRKETKDHGSQRRIEGDDRLAAGAPLVVLEDVVTTGGSTLRAVAELRERPFHVVGVVALVDREEGGVNRIREEGIPCKAVFTRSELDGF